MDLARPDRGGHTRWAASGRQVRVANQDGVHEFYGGKRRVRLGQSRADCEVGQRRPPRRRAVDRNRAPRRLSDARSARGNGRALDTRPVVSSRSQPTPANLPALRRRWSPIRRGDPARRRRGRRLPGVGTGNGARSASMARPGGRSLDDVSGLATVTVSVVRRGRSWPVASRRRVAMSWSEERPRSRSRRTVGADLGVFAAGPHVCG
jgi:hypothetical protein